MYMHVYVHVHVNAYVSTNIGAPKLYYDPYFVHVVQGKVDNLSPVRVS